MALHAGAHGNSPYKNLERFTLKKRFFNRNTVLRLLPALYMLALSSMLNSQVPLQNEQIRLLVWADLDAFPGVFEDPPDKIASESRSFTPSAETDSPQETADENHQFHILFDYAINRTKEIAPFLLGGMLDGWSFEYTPYDKARHVEEYWSFEEIQPFNPSVNTIDYHDPEPRDDRLLCWIYCERTQEQQESYRYWTSITHPHIHGQGKASVQNGFKGIKEACSNALKQAVRDYWRTLIKNKPKEIDGKVLLIREPRVHIKDGQYVVDLDFFLQTDRIISYSLY